MSSPKTIRYAGATYHLATVYEPKKGQIIISGKTLSDAFAEVTPEMAADLAYQAIMAKSASKVDAFLDQFNRAIGGFGVEAIRSEDVWDNYYADAIALFIETGDVYNTTILYDVDEHEFYVTTVGDWVEAWEHQTGQKVK